MWLPRVDGGVPISGEEGGEKRRVRAEGGKETRGGVGMKRELRLDMGGGECVGGGQ